MSDIIKHNPTGPLAVFSKPNALQEAEDKLLVSIKRALLTCYFELNQVVPSDIDLTVLVNKILDSILEKYTSIRADEIATAFSNGIRKQYGEYYGLSLISLEQFIEGYLADPKRVEEAKKHYKALEQKTEPTANQKYDTAKHLVIEAFMIVKNGGVPTKTATTVYTFLDGIGLIDKDYKKGMYKPAMEKLIQESQKEIEFCGDMMKRRLLNVRLNDLIENLANDSITQQQHDEIIRTGKRLILVNVMRDWLIDETDVDALIETKRPV